MGQILLRELQSWYNAVNNIVNIAKGSASNNKKDFGGISISSSTTAKASDVNALATKLQAFKNDEILGSNSTDKALYGPPASVSVGGTIQTGTKNSYDTIVSNLAVIKCRNIATNAYGVCGNVSKSNQKNSSGTCSSGTNNNNNYSNGTCSNKLNSHSTHSHGDKNNSQNSNGNHSNGSYLEGAHTISQKAISRKSNGTCSSGTKSNYTCSNLTNQNQYKSNTNKSNGNKSYGTYSDGNKDNGTNSNQAKSNQTHSSGSNNYTTTIDIRCSQSSKTNN